MDLIASSAYLKSVKVFFRTYLSTILVLGTLVSIPTMVLAQTSTSDNLPDFTAQTTINKSDPIIEAEEVAKKLANPVANMISVPFQYDYYHGLGKDQSGTAQTLIVQPVIPIDLKGGDNIIMRPVTTTVWENNVNGFSGYGLNNVTLETFYTPNTGSSLIYGIGPIIATPAGSSGRFGSQQTGAGITGVLLDRKGPWTYGGLVYQTWSVGGNGASGTQNNFYYQPFIAYVTKSAYTFTILSQSTYNYDVHKTINPYFFTIGKLVVHDNLPVNYTLGVSYMGTTVPGGAQGFGGRAQITFAFPK
jgi:hypothetical protein